MLARVLLNIWFIFCFPTVISLTSSVLFLWLTQFWMILGLFTTGSCNLFVHRTTLCMHFFKYMWNIHLLTAHNYHGIQVNWVTGFSCLLAGKKLSVAEGCSFSIPSVVLVILADTHFEYIVIYSFQLSLFANIWTPINYHCWHKWWQQLHINWI